MSQGRDDVTRKPPETERLTKGPSARRQRWEMLLGILAFFSLISLVITVITEVRGDSALAEVVVLVGFLIATYAAYRAWQRSP